VRRCGELPLVLVSMTIDTALKFNLELRVFSFGNMTLRAFKSRMLALQRVKRGSVILDCKFGRLPTIYRVTSCALCTARAFCELPLVRVWFVTVHALSEHDRPFEITIPMTLPAVHHLMFSKQRKFRFGMIETTSKLAG
jgi:hypothetical protein